MFILWQALTRVIRVSDLLSLISVILYTNDVLLEF